MTAWILAIIALAGIEVGNREVPVAVRKDRGAASRLASLGGHARTHHGLAVGAGEAATELGRGDGQRCREQQGKRAC